MKFKEISLFYYLLCIIFILLLIFLPYSISFSETLDPNASIINLDPTKTYTITETINYIDPVTINGNGAIITVENIGNNPALVIQGNSSILDNFTLNCEAFHGDGNGDNDFLDQEDNIEGNSRRGIKITGHNVLCEHLNIINAPYGISFENCVGGNLKSSCVYNNIVNVDSGIKSYHAGIILSDATDIIIDNCEIDGHGQSILVSGILGLVADIRISDCIIKNNSNNGVYISTGANIRIEDCIISMFNSSGIKVDGNNHYIIDNTIFCNASAPMNGIAASCDTSLCNVIIEDNKIYGDAINGILCSDISTGQIKDNYIEFNESPSRPVYAIHVTSSDTQGLKIIDNIAKNHSFGVLLQGYHIYALIKDNVFNGGSNDGLSLTGLEYSVVNENSCANLGTGRSGICMNNGFNNRIINNNFSNNRYGIEEIGSSTANEYAFNNLENTLFNVLLGTSKNIE